MFADLQPANPLRCPQPAQMAGQAELVAVAAAVTVAVAALAAPAVQGHRRLLKNCSLHFSLVEAAMAKHLAAAACFEYAAAVAAATITHWAGCGTGARYWPLDCFRKYEMLCRQGAGARCLPARPASKQCEDGVSHASARPRIGNFAKTEGVERTDTIHHRALGTSSAKHRREWPKRKCASYRLRLRTNASWAR